MGIHSIWNNPYYKNYTPLPKWSFAVNFLNFFINNINKTASEYADTVSQAIVNCTWGKREISLVETFYAGISAKFPARVQNSGELSMTFNENSNLDISKILDELFTGECSSDQYFTGEDNYITNKEFNKLDRTIILDILEPSYEMDAESGAGLIAEIEFHNCILIAINEEEFNYTQTDDVLQRTARISYDYMIWRNRERVINGTIGAV